MAVSKKANVQKSKDTTITCSCCGKTKKDDEFYISNAFIYKAIGRLTVCKGCMEGIYDDYYTKFSDEKMALYYMCRALCICFNISSFNAAIAQRESSDRTTPIWRVYMTKLNSLGGNNGAGDDFDSSDNPVSDKSEENETDDVEIEKVNIKERDKQNEIDVIRILGYDPFENENNKDRKFLFNRLVDMLDDSVVEDNVKLMSVITIVKGFNQVEYVDMAIARITADINNLNNNNGNLKSLIDAKKNLMTTILKACEDNGISTKFNTNKSKGSGTLTGMIKKLGELNLDESRVNLFDMQTSQGMEQVADLSHASIMKQLQFDENDYADMVAWQKDEIFKMTKEKDKLEEELRLLKINLSTKEVVYDGVE